MLEITFFLLALGVSSGLIGFTVAHVYRTISDVKMKKRAFERSLEHLHEDKDDADELATRLEEIRRTRFGLSVTNAPMGTEQIVKKPSAPSVRMLREGQLPKVTRK